MTLTTVQTLVILLCVTLGTMTTRFLPFLLFPEGKKQPKFINYLGNILPTAMMGLLVIYCLKGVSLISWPYGLPELISIAITAALQLWRRNVLLSICAGTVCYMLLVQFVFVNV